MKKSILLLTLLLLAACRHVPLTDDGGQIVVLRSTAQPAPECVVLGTVVGQHKLGSAQALNIVRNRAAALGADTVMITTVEGWKSPSRRITASAFDCKGHHVQPIQAAGETSPDSTQATFDKAKKCQSKGGVWVNDQCIVEVE